MAAIVGFKAQASKRHHESDDESVENESGMSSDEEIEETPEEKRLRLATIYLEEIQRKGIALFVKLHPQFSMTTELFL